VRGDANVDGTVDLSDSVRILARLFRGGPDSPCLQASDVNEDDRIDISDSIFGLNFLFLGGVAPPAPYPRYAQFDWWGTYQELDPTSPQKRARAQRRAGSSGSMR